MLKLSYYFCSNSGRGGKENLDYEAKLEFYGEIDGEVCRVGSRMLQCPNYFSELVDHRKYMFASKYCCVGVDLGRECLFL